MKTITIIDLGTYADFKLTYTLVKKFLARGYYVIYITEKSNNIYKPNKNLNVVLYNLSGILDLSQPKNFQIPLEFNSLFTPSNIHLSVYIKFTIGPLINKNIEKSDFVLLHYPALLLLSNVSKNKLDKIPIGIFYVSPAYSNTEIPYIMSSEMKDFDVSDKKTYTSSDKYHRMISMLSGKTDYFDKILKRSYIYSMWSQVSLKLPKTELDLNIKNLGPIYDSIDIKKYHNEKIDIILPDEVRAFLGCKGRKVYFSTGSFCLDDKICIIVKALVEMKNIVFYHGKNTKYVDFLNEKYPNNFFHTDMHIPHEYIIPKVSFVITSGSLGMTTISNLYGIPLIYSPILNEQYFWANVYKNNSGQGFIDTNKTYKENDEEKFYNDIYLQAKKSISNIDKLETLITFTKNIQINTSKNDYAKNLVDDIIAKLQ